MYGWKKKIASLKLCTSQENQWNIQRIVIKFFVIILTRTLQTNFSNLSDNTRLKTIKNDNSFKTLLSLFSLPFTSTWWMLGGFASFLVLPHLPASLFVTLSNSSFWNRYRVVQGKLKVSALAGPGWFPKHCSKQSCLSPAAKTHTGE